MNKIIYNILLLLLFTAHAHAISPESTVSQIVSVIKSSRDLSRLTEFYNWGQDANSMARDDISTKLKYNGKNLLEQFRKESKTNEEKAKLLLVEQEYNNKLAEFNTRIDKAIFTSTTQSVDQTKAVVVVTRSIDGQSVTQTINMSNVDGKWLLDNLSIFNTVIGHTPTVFGSTIDPRMAILNK